MPGNSFVHLRAHSAYSVEDGLIQPKDLPALAAAAAQPAIAITDLNRMFGVVPFYRAAREAGVKPIVGADVWIDQDVVSPDTQAPPERILLLAQDTAGYRRLMHLLSRAYTQNHRAGQARIKQSWLRDEGTQGLIALSGDAATGALGRAVVAAATPQASDEAKAEPERIANVYRGLFGDRYYLEIQRAGQPDEAAFVDGVVALAARTGIAPVATHPVQFAQRGDFFLHEVRACVATGERVEDPGRRPAFTREQHFQTTPQMHELFSDLPEALENAALIAQRCSTSIDLGHTYLPQFATPDGSSTQEYFERQARAGLEKRLEVLFPDPAERAARRQPFDQRLDSEIKTIVRMGFPGYYLIVSDFINWAKDHGIPVGPGRGSGAGSLVAYAMRITDIEPLRFGLLFERFLNPERVSMPDFDVDFEMARRDEVIDYVRDRYGRDAVSQIATINAMSAKSSIHDAGRALGYQPFLTKTLADMVPAKPLDLTLDDALGLSKRSQEEPALVSARLREKYDSDRGLRRLLDVARRLDGVPRAIGKGAAGVLIAPGPIADYAPLYVPDDAASVVSQYDIESVEKVGLVKFDFLGLRTLTVIQQAVNLVNALPERKNDPLDMASVPLDDAGVYDALSSGSTDTIFQLEGDGMTALIKDLKPDRFEDIIAIISLFRPGPMDLIPDYIRRKRGLVPVEYPDPRVEPVLRETYGIMVYQEQVMQMAQIVGGYTLGAADMLRRAMGKKKPEEMAKQREIFRSGAAANGVPAAKADAIFDLMEKFAGYGFNKSHAAAYGMITYHTAWLKHHYPAQYYCAYMNVLAVDDSKQEKLALPLRSARSQGLAVLPPDINASVQSFRVDGPRAIRYGLAGLKGVGQAPVDAIIAEREKNGPFASFNDFFARVDRRASNKTVVSSLIRAGAFDSLHPNRAELMATLPAAIEYAQKLAAAAPPPVLGDLPPAKTAAKQVAAPRRKSSRPAKPVIPPAIVPTQPWDPIQSLEEEKRAVGFYFSGHPFEGYKARLGGLPSLLPLSQVDEQACDDDRPWLVAGVVSRLREHTPPSGKKMAFLTLDDGVHEKDVTLFSSAWEGQDWIKKGQFLAAEVRLRPDRRDSAKNDMTAEGVWSFDELRAHLMSSVSLAVRPQDLEQVRAILERHAPPPGKPSAKVQVYLPDKQDDMRFFKAQLPHHEVLPVTAMLEDLEGCLGQARVAAEYRQKMVFPQRERPGKRKRNKP